MSKSNFLSNYILPLLDKVKSSKSVRKIASRINDKSIWKYSKQNIPLSLLIGLITAFIPVPFQMVISAYFAVLFRANLPISVALVWITNPITMPVLFYIGYLFGLYVLTGLTFTSLVENYLFVFFLGNILFGVCLGVMAYFIAKLIFKFYFKTF